MVGGLVRLATRILPRPLLHRVGVMAGWCMAQCMRGNRYEDPIDGFGYRSLLPYGRVTKRANALAPHSLSLERHRMLWLYLTRELRIEQAQQLRVLHMAPEWALLRRLRRMKGLRYTTADLSSPWASVHCDIQELPFDDASFDLILCNHVLEHIPDDRQAMRELYRVLAPGGTALLLVPLDTTRSTTLEDPSINTPALREQFYWQRDHLRLYGLDYPARLTDAGFAVEVVDYAASLGPEACQRHAIRTDEPLYIGRKSEEDRNAV